MASVLPGIYDAGFTSLFVFRCTERAPTKPTLASQVGALYEPGDRRTTDAYQLYYIGISSGAFFGAMICGALGEKVAWHWGFGAAGVPTIDRPYRVRRRACECAE